MWFGQLVIGPPGAGKSTFCHGMHQILQALERKHVVVNLDPANEDPQFHYDIDVRDLVDLSVVMEDFKLGPNGALLYAIEYLLENFDWLESALKEHPDQYVIIDFPGQIELYSHHTVLRKIVDKLTKLDCRLAAVHLVDSTLCLDPHKYMSAVIVCLSAMMMLELPHVNLLSKVDLIKKFKKDLPFPFEMYVEAQDLEAISSHRPGETQHPRYGRLMEAFSEILEDYNMVSFLPLDVMDKKSMVYCLRAIDKSNGLGAAMSSFKSDFEYAMKCTQYDRDEMMNAISDKHLESDDDENDPCGKNQFGKIRERGENGEYDDRDDDERDGEDDEEEGVFIEACRPLANHFIPPEKITLDYEASGIREIKNQP